jgi:hypothetical protein
VLASLAGVLRERGCSSNTAAEMDTAQMMTSSSDVSITDTDAIEAREATKRADAAVTIAASLVRRAAALAARLVLDAPGAVGALARTGLLRDFYAALQNARARDIDRVVRGHATDALAAIDEGLLAMAVPQVSMPGSSRSRGSGGARLPNASLSAV